MGTAWLVPDSDGRPVRLAHRAGSEKDTRGDVGLIMADMERGWSKNNTNNQSSIKPRSLRFKSQQSYQIVNKI